jgi:hypothetical protein
MTRQADRPARPQAGYQLPQLEKTIFQRALAERSFSEDSIHNNDYTTQHGYPGALVSAYVLAGYMSEPMVTFFGKSWFTTGEIALRFIGKGVQQGNKVTIGGAVREVQEAADGASPRVVLDIWMEKDGGVRPVIGTASAVLDGPS